MSSSSEEDGQLLSHTQLSLFKRPTEGELYYPADLGDVETQSEGLPCEQLAMFLQPTITSRRVPLSEMSDVPSFTSKSERDDIARRCVMSTRPITSVKPRAEKDRQAYAERKLVYEVVSARKTGSLRTELLSRLEIVAAQTPEGSKIFPDLAALSATVHQHSDFVRASALAFAELGRAHRKNVCKLVLQNVPTQYVKDHLLMTAGEVKYIKNNRIRAIDRANVEKQDVVHQRMILNITRKKIRDPETQLLKLFYHETTSVLSGSSTETRNLDMTILDWGFELYSRYPRYLYALGCVKPELLEQDPTTKFLREMRAASKLYAQECFDIEAHVDLRRTHVYSAYIEKQCTAKGWTAPPIPPITDGIKGVGFDTFLKVLERLDYKWTKFVSPYPCDLCDNFVIWERRYESICSLISSHISLSGDVEETAEFKALIRKKRILFDKLNEGRLHALQVVACRAEAERMRDAQLPGSVFVTRDYVNHHDVSGPGFQIT